MSNPGPAAPFSFATRTAGYTSAARSWTGIPPRRFACTWLVEGVENFGELPECLVTYEIEPAGGSVRLTMTESHSWDIPPGVLAGGQSGWPAILSGLKSVLETGKPLSIDMKPPEGFMDAVRQVIAEKPWLK